MKIAIGTVQVPFIQGGAETHAEVLKKELNIRGYEVDIVSIPFKWYPSSTLVDCMRMARMVDLSEVNGKSIDLLINLKFPMYYTEHKNKVLWLLHQHRQAYELWGTKYGDLEKMEHGDRLREMIIRTDNRCISEHKKIFANSSTVAKRLMKYNRIKSTPLYHPPARHEELFCKNFSDFVFYPSRLDDLKRQHILVKAMYYTKTPVKAIIAGSCPSNYIHSLKSLIHNYGLQNKVQLVGYVPFEDKVRYYSESLCVYNGPYQEDYGYVTLEAFYSGKPVITHRDSGGPLEFVQDDKNGYIVEPDPVKVAEKLDFLYENKQKATVMGMNGTRLMKELQINWDHVIERLVK